MWVRLDALDDVLRGLIPDMDPQWGVTEYIANLWSPANIPNSPSEWTDPPEAPDDKRRTSEDW